MKIIKNSHATLCNIMSGSLLFCLLPIIIAKEFGFLVILYIVSILISTCIIYLLPKVKKVNSYIIRMKYNLIVSWFILVLGPITTVFILTTLLLKEKS